MDKIFTASRFKAECLALLDDVAVTGSTLTVTKHGRPVARVVPIQPSLPLRGSVTFKVSDEELTEPVPEAWDATPPAHP